MPSISYHTHNTIKSIIRHTCDVNDASWLAETIGFKFNNKLTSTWGKAHQPNMMIELSTLLWLAKPVDRHDTVTHEVCHIIAWHKYNERKPHGKMWRLCMRRAKMNPKIAADTSMTI
jgi:predicted SprT family Zn-dependent metalloprotease